MKKKIEKKLEKIFQTMACDNPYHAVHTTAAASAAIVAVCPIGIDAWALRLAEVLMLVSIYGHYGEMKQMCSMVIGNVVRKFMR